MKFSVEWIKEYLDTTLSSQEICDVLNKIGFEAQVDFVLPDLSQYVIAQIEKIEKHPNADKLSICTINNGSEQLEIVCGASNVRESMCVIFAPIGSILPSGMEIKKAKIRGVESYGMLCSYNEIGIENFYSCDGIADLDVQYVRIGQKFSDTDYAKYVSDVIEIEFTSNRRDAANIMSIARELSTAGVGRLSLNYDKYTNDYVLKMLKDNQIEDTYSRVSDQLRGKFKNYVNVESKTSLFSCCKLTGVKNTRSPMFIEARLSGSGIKVISCLVDITNYIAHEIGRPLHIFDYDKIDGGLKVHNLTDKAEFLSLKNEKIDLCDQSLVISDQKKIISLAGVMGALNSCCDMNTKNILIESAYFDYKDIILSGRFTNIASQARYRFEKGMNKELTLFGLLKTINMVQEYCSGDVEFYDFNGDFTSEKRLIKFNTQSISKLIGIQIDNQFVEGVLNGLKFNFTKISDNEYDICVPYNRLHDIHSTNDLIEEIVRFYGYDNVPLQSLSSYSIRHSKKSIFNQIQMTKKNIAYLGYYDTINWSFIPHKAVSLFSMVSKILLDKAIDKVVKIANPISSDMCTMRQNIAHAMLSNVSYHRKYLLEFKGFFEIGHVYYYDQNNDIREDLVLSCVMDFNNQQVKNFYTKHDSKNSAKLSAIMYFKADIMSIMQNYVSLEKIKFVNMEDEDLNGAIIYYLDEVIGYIGVFSRKITDQYDIKNDFAICEINFSKVYGIVENNLSQKMEYSNYQPVSRDYCFAVHRNIQLDDFVQNITLAVNHIDGKIVQNVTIFDVFNEKNEQNEEIFSVGIRLILQHHDRTFSEADLVSIQKTIIQTAKNHGAVLKNFDSDL